MSNYGAGALAIAEQNRSDRAARYAQDEAAAADRRRYIAEREADEARADARKFSFALSDAEYQIDALKMVIEKMCEVIHELDPANLHARQDVADALVVVYSNAQYPKLTKERAAKRRGFTLTIPDGRLSNVENIPLGNLMIKHYFDGRDLECAREAQKMIDAITAEVKQRVDEDDDRNFFTSLNKVKRAALDGEYQEAAGNSTMMADYMINVVKFHEATAARAQLLAGVGIDADDLDCEIREQVDASDAAKAMKALSSSLENLMIKHHFDGRDLECTREAQKKVDAITAEVKQRVVEDDGRGFFTSLNKVKRAALDGEYQAAAGNSALMDDYMSHVVKYHEATAARNQRLLRVTSRRG